MVADTADLTIENGFLNVLAQGGAIVDADDRAVSVNDSFTTLNAINLNSQTRFDILLDNVDGGGVSRHDFTYIDAGNDVIANGANIIIGDRNDLSVFVTAEGDATVFTFGDANVMGGFTLPSDNNVEGDLLVTSDTGFAHAGTGFGNGNPIMLMVGNDATVTALGLAGNAEDHTAGLRGVIGNDAIVTGPGGAAFLGEAGNDLTVTAEFGSAIVDGKPDPINGDVAIVGNNLLVTAQDDIVVHADTIGGTMTLTETDTNDAGDATDRIFANVNIVTGLATVTANGGNADLKANELQGGLVQEALNGNANASVGLLTGDARVTWNDLDDGPDSVIAVDGTTIENFVAGPVGAADIPPGFAGDVAVSGTFNGYHVDVMSNQGVVLGGGIEIADLTVTVAFDDTAPFAPRFPTGIDGVETGHAPGMTIDPNNVEVLIGTLDVNAFGGAIVDADDQAVLVNNGHTTLIAETRNGTDRFDVLLDNVDGGVSRHDLIYVDDGGMVTAEGNNVTVGDSDDLSIEVSASGNATIFADGNVEAKAGVNTPANGVPLSGPTVGGSLDVDSETGFAHAGSGDANTLTVGGNAEVDAETSAGLRGDVTGDVTGVTSRTADAALLGTVGGNAEVTANAGSAIVDGIEDNVQASVGGDLVVSVLDNAVVDASDVGGDLSVTQIAGGTGNVSVNVGSVDGATEVIANEGNATLVAGILGDGVDNGSPDGDGVDNFQVLAPNGEARAIVDTFNGSNFLVEWSTSTVGAIDPTADDEDVRGDSDPATDIVIGPIFGSGDVAIQGFFDERNVNVQTDNGVTFGAGIFVSDQTQTVVFDNADPFAPDIPDDLDGVETGSVFGPDGFNTGTGNVETNGDLYALTDQGSATPNGDRDLTDRDAGTVETGQDIRQAGGTTVIVDGITTLDANLVSVVDLPSAGNDFGDPSDSTESLVHVRGERVNLVDATDIQFGAVATPEFFVDAGGSIYFRQVLGLPVGETQDVRVGPEGQVGVSPGTAFGEGEVGDVDLNAGGDVIIGQLPNGDPLLSAPGEPGFREDIFYVNNLTVSNDGDLLLPRTPDTDWSFDDSLRYYGVNISDTFRFDGSQDNIDLLGFIRVVRSKVAGLLPVGPRSADYEFNNCIIGDTNSCGVLPPVDILGSVPSIPELFELDLDHLGNTYVPVGNEEIWGNCSPPSLNRGLPEGN